MAIIMPYKSAAPKIDESVYLAPTAVVTGDVTIEEGTSIWFGAVVRGDFQPIKIGKNTNIQENATIHVMHDHPTTIGEGVSIGHNAVIHSKSIGDHTLIGMGAIIMGDTVIGENVVIGAGTMGAGIAQAFAVTDGYEVVLCDIKQEFADGGKAKIEKSSGCNHMTCV